MIISQDSCGVADGAKNAAVALSRSGNPVRPKAVYITDAKTFDTVYGPEEREEIGRLLDVAPQALSKEEIQREPSLLRDVEIVMTSWGMPRMDAGLLAAAPNLRAIFYAAGSVRYFATPALWARQITISSAYSVNALPVAEYALGTILLSLKRFWFHAHAVRAETDPWADHNRSMPGVYRSTVGLLSCGMIARRLIQLLKPFEVRCLVYDPYVTEEEMLELGAELCSLEEVFKRSDVVSVHTPLLPETSGFIRGRLVDTMKPGATLINTARGGLISQRELAEVLGRRTDLTAVLDVLDTEPPLRGTPLLQLPNVWVTPHIAGSLGQECRRMGRAMVEELHRYLAGEPLHWRILEDFANKLA